MTENPLSKKLEGHKIILASGSPRRRKFFEEMGIEFEIRLKPVDEVYPNQLKAEEISNYLAELKASALQPSLQENEILITSDTVVWHKGESLEKASSKEEAQEMLQKLSGDWHEVITSVCFTTTNGQQTISSSTKVKFKTLTPSEIEFYIDSSQPFDKAGAYGIQEWLGAIAIEEINGSYNTVVGLPTHLVYKVLNEL
jgi:septum formation protein